jgi:hypothetical protein
MEPHGVEFSQGSSSTQSPFPGQSESGISCDLETFGSFTLVAEAICGDISRHCVEVEQGCPRQVEPVLSPGKQSWSKCWKSEATIPCVCDTTAFPKRL